MALRDGDLEHDCLAILDRLYRSEQAGSSVSERASRWNLLWNDLQNRASGLDDRTRRRLLDAALASQLPAQYRPADWQIYLTESSTRPGEKRAADVIVLCVIEQEFISTLVAFGIDPQTEEETDLICGHRFYRVNLNSHHCGRLSVWIGLIGEARNIVCANFCRTVFEAFDIKHCCVLVGIAAGYKKKVRLGDVVAARDVIDIEGARLEPAITKPRPVPYRMVPPLRPLFLGFSPDRFDWLGDRITGIEQLKRTGSKVLKAGEARKPSYQVATIVAGEKLRRDDPLPELVRHLSDDILAIEMEGSGFVASCEAKKVRWLLFRGVSDYGDMGKRKSWQPIAAFHAALAAKCFLSEGLRALDETDF